MPESRVWFITGASSGLGRAMAEAALAAEDAPLRLVLGSDAAEAIGAHLDASRSELTTWETLSRSTDFPA